MIGDTLLNIKKSRGRDLPVSEIPLQDEETAKMLCDGQTGAVFQMESAGMTALVKDLQPEGFEDLIPLVALYRPGPLGSGMVQDFINGRHGKKTVTYLHPLLEPILRETFGVVLYQEQVMQIVQVLAGFTLGQADLLRRAMGHKQPELLMKQKESFLQGAKAQHIEPDLANKIFELLTHFANYGFNKSHSAAYALVAWRTAYLKVHYPAEFMAAMLSSIMDDSGKVGIYIEQCRHMGIAILPPDINASSASFSVDGASIRFGLAAVRNVGEAAIHSIETIRDDSGPFHSLVDFCSRIDMRAVNKRVVESLIKCGAFDSLGAKRSQLLAVLEPAIDSAARRQRDLASGQLDLFSDMAMNEADAIHLPDIPEAEQGERLTWEKEITGFYITGHPLDKYQDKIKNFCRIETVLNGELPDGKLVRLAGLISSAKRIATKKGDTMCFATLEDFTHSIEIIAFPRVFYEHVNLFAPDMAVVIQGRVNMTDKGAKILVDQVCSLDEYRSEYYITIRAEQDNDATIQALQQILTNHHGDHVVYLHFVAKNRRIRAASQFWLNQSPGVAAEIEALLGTGAIKQR